MRQFIISHFVKDPDNLKSPETRESYGTVAGIVGILSNMILCALKVSCGLIFNSIAILADGINNLSDASGSIFTLLGFKLAAKKPDKEHPYGHGRTEYLAGLVVSVMVLAIGVSLIASSVKKTFHPEEIDYSVLSIAMLIVSILIKLWQASFNVFVGKKIASDVLLATGQDSRNDVLSTGAVLLSVLIGRFSGLNLDGPVGIVVGFFIVWSGIGLVKENLAPILGQAPDPELVNGIREAILSPEEVLGVHDLIVHDYGPSRLFASAHAEVDSTRDIFSVHDTIDNIEHAVYERFGVVLTIHMDPVEVNDPLTNEAKQALSEIVRTMEGVSGVHDVRVVHGDTHHNVVFDVVADYTCRMTNAEIREELATKLKEYNPMFVSVPTIDHRYS